MAFIYPIENFLTPVSPASPSGELDDLIQTQLSVLEGAIRNGAVESEQAGNPAQPFDKFAETANVLFTGGEFPNLTGQRDAKAAEIKPIRHLFPAVILTTAWLDTDGLAGFADGLSLIEQLLTTMWDRLHPQAEVDEITNTYPYWGRTARLSPLAFPDPARDQKMQGAKLSKDSWQIEARLLKAVLLESGTHGPLSLGDAISPWAEEKSITLTNVQPRTSEFVYEVRLGAIDMLDGKRQALSAAVESLGKIGKFFADAPDTMKPDFTYLIRILNAARSVVDDNAQPKTNSDPVTPTLDSDDKTKKKAVVSGPVASREDAIRKLTEVAEYFRRTEPANPIPLFIDRVKKMAGMNFLSLLKELNLGDNVVADFQKLVGYKEEAEAETKDAGGKPSV